jgi:flagellar basal body-associated protein FliL
MSDDEEGEIAAPAAAGGKSKVLPMLLVINTLLLTGVLIFVMKRPAAHAAADAKPAAAEASGEHAEHGEEKEKSGGHGADDSSGMGPTVRFDNFTVQLKSTDVDRYAHLSIEIEVIDEAAKGVLEKKVAPIRDAILSYLSDCTPDELRGSDGLKQIKESMVKKLEEMITGHRIRALYITDFIIQ